MSDIHIGSDLQFEAGSDIEIAHAAIALLKDKVGQIVFTEERFWFFNKTAWEPIDERGQLRKIIHGFDRVMFGKNSLVSLNKRRIDSIIFEMGTQLSNRDFFAEPRSGINCASGFIEFDDDGTARLIGHDPDHRCRHTLAAKWMPGTNPNPQAGSLFQWYLNGIMKEDVERDAKIAILQETAGAAAAGLGTRIKQPKAIVLLGKEANNGKTEYLVLIRGLLPDGGCSSVSPGDFAKEQYRAKLAGKLLNTSDELGNSYAITSDVFKMIITGRGGVQAKEVYQKVIDLHPMAQHVYATNTLPPFTGGMDRGVQRRLLPVNFEKPVAEEDRVPEIGSRILDGESDLVLAWAVAGASRLIRQGGFTQCAVCHETLQAWMRDSDPVKAWAAARVRLGEIPAVFNQNGYRKREVYAHFTEWAEEYGYRKDRIPSPPQFWERLGQDFPVVLKRKLDSRAIRGITILLGDDGDLDGVDAPANDNCPISEKINNLTSAYNNVAAAGLHKKPGTNAYVDETGCEVWGEELDMAVRQGKRVAKH